MVLSCREGLSHSANRIDTTCGHTNGRSNVSLLPLAPRATDPFGLEFSYWLSLSCVPIETTSEKVVLMRCSLPAGAIHAVGVLIPMSFQIRGAVGLFKRKFNVCRRENSIE